MVSAVRGGLVQGAGLGELRWDVSWPQRSPFHRSEDSVEHILELLAKEAEKARIPLTDAERRTLTVKWDPATTIADELHAKARKLVELVFDHEADVDAPKSLGNSLQWATESGHSNITVVIEEVIRSRNEALPRLRGRKWIVDRIQLVGCGFVAIVLMMLFWAAVDRLFSSK